MSFASGKSQGVMCHEDAVDRASVRYISLLAHDLILNQHQISCANFPDLYLDDVSPP